MWRGEGDPFVTRALYFFLISLIYQTFIGSTAEKQLKKKTNLIFNEKIEKRI